MGISPAVLGGGNVEGREDLADGIDGSVDDGGAAISYDGCIARDGVGCGDDVTCDAPFFALVEGDGGQGVSISRVYAAESLTAGVVGVEGEAEAAGGDEFLSTEVGKPGGGA